MIKKGYNLLNSYSCLLSEKEEIPKLIKQINYYFNLIDYKNDVDLYIRFAVNNELYDNGVTVYVYPESELYGKAKDIGTSISSLGYKYNGVHILKKNKYKNAILLFCCFADNGIDYSIYNMNNMAKAIVYGLTRINIDTAFNTIYNDVDYGLVYSYIDYKQNHEEVANLSSDECLEYFVKQGMDLGHKAKNTFDVHFYKKEYPELIFEDDLKSYYIHYLLHGYFENREHYDGTLNNKFPKTVKVNVNSLPVRRGAGQSYEQIKVLSKGDVVNITHAIGSYGQIGKTYGWINISNDFVKYI